MCKQSTVMARNLTLSFTSRATIFSSPPRERERERQRERQRERERQRDREREREREGGRERGREREREIRLLCVHVGAVLYNCHKLNWHETFTEANNYKIFQ